MSFGFVPTRNMESSRSQDNFADQHGRYITQSSPSFSFLSCCSCLFVVKLSFKGFISHYLVNVWGGDRNFFAHNFTGFEATTTVVSSLLSSFLATVVTESVVAWSVVESTLLSTFLSAVSANTTGFANFVAVRLWWRWWWWVVTAVGGTN